MNSQQSRKDSSDLRGLRVFGTSWVHSAQAKLETTLEIVRRARRSEMVHEGVDCKQLAPGVFLRVKKRSRPTVDSCCLSLCCELCSGGLAVVAKKKKEETKTKMLVGVGRVTVVAVARSPCCL